MGLNDVPAVYASARRMETRALVEEFLLATERMPQDEAVRIAGVGVATLQRWERSGAKQLHGPIRRRLHIHLAKRALQAG